MATNINTELSEFNINDVESDELLQQMADENLLEEHQFYVTPDPDKEPSGGTKIIWREWE